MDSQNREADTVGENKKKRKSFTRENKLTVIKWYIQNGKNVAHTALHFSIHRKHVRTWINTAEVIRNSKKGTKKLKSGRKAKYPLAERKLHDEFNIMPSEGRPAKRYWFNHKMAQLVREYHPDTADDFRHSDQWFSGFQHRWNISLRAKTHVSQKSPADCMSVILNFHRRLLLVRKRWMFQLCDIANMDQTPLPFILDDGKTYNKSGEKHIWCASGPSGLSKRQCTVQLTIFADGVPRIKPLLIFRGKGIRIKKTEKDKWDKRVSVCFQKDAWCDEQVMKDWVIKEWNNYFTNPPTPGSHGKLLVIDTHRGQQTECIKDLLNKCKTTVVYVPGGTTAYIQPLDVVVNGPYKNIVKTLYEKHMQENLEKYVNSKFTASDRRVLMTKWCGQAWQELDSALVKRGFKKCGISTEVDGSENHLVRIENIPDYEMPINESIDSDEEYSLLSDDDDSEPNDLEYGAASEKDTNDNDRINTESDSDDERSLASEDAHVNVESDGGDETSISSDDGSQHQNLPFKELVLNHVVLHEGDYVKIIHGSFMNLYAVVESVEEDEIRIRYFKE